MNKYIEQVDRETGEVMQGCMVYIPYRPRLTERWFMAFQDTFIEIAKDPDMTGETMKVLMYLFGKLDFENFIQQTQIDVAEGLGMRKQNVNRAMQILTAKQIVLKARRSDDPNAIGLIQIMDGKAKLKPFKNCEKEQFKVIEGGKE